MDVSVRYISKADITGLHAALNSVVQERKFLLTTETPAMENHSLFVRNNIACNHAQYVALHNGSIVGWADVIPHQKELTKHVGLLGMGVVADYRGQGIGKELLAQTVEHAKVSGLKKVELEVFTNNLPAIALYRNTGFELEGTKRLARYINGQYEDVHIMGLCFN